MFNPTITADILSRGKRYWMDQIRILNRKFSRTVGDASLQLIANQIFWAQNVAAQCQTYGPCSRTAYLEKVGA